MYSPNINNTNSNSNSDNGTVVVENDASPLEQWKRQQQQWQNDNKRQMTSSSLTYRATNDGTPYKTKTTFHNRIEASPSLIMVGAKPPIRPPLAAAVVATSTTATVDVAVATTTTTTTKMTTTVVAPGKCPSQQPFHDKNNTHYNSCGNNDSNNKYDQEIDVTETTESLTNLHEDDDDINIFDNELLQM